MARSPCFFPLVRFEELTHVALCRLAAQGIAVTWTRDARALKGEVDECALALSALSVPLSVVLAAAKTVEKTGISGIVWRSRTRCGSRRADFSPAWASSTVLVAAMKLWSCV
jgi:hypothetical protein